MIRLRRRYSVRVPSGEVQPGCLCSQPWRRASLLNPGRVGQVEQQGFGCHLPIHFTFSPSSHMAAGVYASAQAKSEMGRRVRRPALKYVQRVNTPMASGQAWAANRLSRSRSSTTIRSISDSSAPLQRRGHGRRLAAAHLVGHERHPGLPAGGVDVTFARVKAKIRKATALRAGTSAVLEPVIIWSSAVKSN